MALVRLLLILALIAVGAALFMYLWTRDRRYLRFIVLTIKFAVLMLLGILILSAAERLLIPLGVAL
jgi:hypothetical protein